MILTFWLSKFTSVLVKENIYVTTERYHKTQEGSIVLVSREFLLLKELLFCVTDSTGVRILGLVQKEGKRWTIKRRKERGYEQTEDTTISVTLLIIIILRLHLFPNTRESSGHQINFEDEFC